MPTAATKTIPDTKLLTKKAKKPSKAQIEAERQEHLAFLKREVGASHGRWIRSHRTATLSDLLAYLEGVQEELFAFNDDDVLAEIVNELGDAADYLSDFAPLEEPVDSDGELATVEYRLANVEEDIGFVEELVEAVGGLFKVARLPKRRRKIAGV